MLMYFRCATDGGRLDNGNLFDIRVLLSGGEFKLESIWETKHGQLELKSYIFWIKKIQLCVHEIISFTSVIRKEIQQKLIKTAENVSAGTRYIFILFMVSKLHMKTITTTRLTEIFLLKFVTFSEFQIKTNFFTAGFTNTSHSVFFDKVLIE